MKNRHLRLTGIVIKQFSLKEADKMVTIISPDLGKVVGVARGVKKIKSKLAGSLELFSIGDFELIESKGLNLIVGARTSQRSYQLNQNLPKLSVAYFLAEAADKLTDEGEPVEGLFQLFDELLESLKDDTLSPDSLLSIVKLRLLDIFGMRPELDVCVHCRKKLTAPGNFSISSSQGGVLCGECEQFDPATVKTNVDEVKVMRLAVGNNIKSVARLNRANEALSKVGAQVSRLFDYQINRHFKSSNFIEALSRIN